MKWRRKWNRTEKMQWNISLASKTVYESETQEKVLSLVEYNMYVHTMTMVSIHSIFCINIDKCISLDESSICLFWAVSPPNVTRFTGPVISLKSGWNTYFWTHSPLTEIHIYWGHDCWPWLRTCTIFVPRVHMWNGAIRLSRWRA